MRPMKKLLILALLSSFTLTAQVRPPKPTDKDAVRLAWDYEQGVTPAIKFRVYYGNTPGNYVAFVETTGLEKTVSVNVPEPGVYYFTATAIGLGGVESLPSGEVSHTIIPRPSPPANLSGTRITIFVD